MARVVRQRDGLARTGRGSPSLEGHQFRRLSGSCAEQGAGKSPPACAIYKSSIA